MANRLTSAGSLFSGIGVLDRVVEQYFNVEVSWFAEKNKFVNKLLSHYWPNTPNYGNTYSVNWEDVPKVDILVGGFPCPDISRAGNGSGLSGARSGRWFDFAKAISVLRPRLVIMENVPYVITRKPVIGEVLSSLTEIGYDARWGCLSASSIGAPGVRERWIAVAYPHGEGPQRYRRLDKSSFQWDFTQGFIPSVGGARNFKWGKYKLAIERWERYFGCLAPHPIKDGRYSEEFAEWAMGIFPGYTDVGLSRTRRIEAVGNSVNPFQIYEAIHQLLGDVSWD